MTDLICSFIIFAVMAGGVVFWAIIIIALINKITRMRWGKCQNL